MGTVSMNAAPVLAMSSGRLRMKNKSRRKSKEAALEALKKESERAELEQIRRLLSLPMNRRTHFLRVRLPNGGSAL